MENKSNEDSTKFIVSYSDSEYNFESEGEGEGEGDSEGEQSDTFEYEQDSNDENTDISSVVFVNGSILEEYSEENPCLLCGKGPFCELEYHLHPFCGCGKAWYHPACTIKCLRIAYGQPYFVPIICPFCHPKQQK